MKRSFPIIGTLRVLLAAAFLYALWALWLRPIAPRLGPEPADLRDDWQIAAPGDEGIDAQALHARIEALLDAPLNVHSVLVERHGRLIAEYYQGGGDRSVYALFNVR